ncbi:MAG: hypothetical protein KY476_19620 [Planctomycetes bacterium]|nr:hypothetical protein [Planctomycetota bacterium]
MTSSISTNLSALSAQVQLLRTNNLFNRSLERLSTGLRINRASDDPSGLVLSEFQRAQVSGLGEAISNMDRAISVAQTAEGGLNEIAGLLTDLRGLVVDSASDGTHSPQTLEVNQQNVTSILDAIDRIAHSTRFTTRTLLNSESGLRGVVNEGTGGAIIDFLAAKNSDVVTGQPLPIVVTQNAERAFVTAPTAQTAALAQDERLVINGVAVDLEAGLTQPQVVERLNQLSGQTQAFAVVNGGRTELRSNLFGNGAQVRVISNQAGANDSTGFGINPLSDRGLDVEGTIGAGLAGASGSAAGAAEGLGRILSGRSGEAGSGVSVQLGLANPEDVATTPVAVGDGAAIVAVDRSLLFHVGGFENQNAALSLINADSRALAIGVQAPIRSTVVTTITQDFDQQGPTEVPVNGPVSILSNQIGLPAEPTGTFPVTTQRILISDITTPSFSTNTTVSQVGNQITVTREDVFTSTREVIEETTTTTTIVTPNATPGIIQAINDTFDPNRNATTFRILFNGNERNTPKPDPGGSATQDPPPGLNEFPNGNAFYFDGAGNRFAETFQFNAAAGGTISFDLRIGGPLDTHTFENADPGEEIVLEFSTGTQTPIGSTAPTLTGFTTIRDFDTHPQGPGTPSFDFDNDAANFPADAWQNVSVNIPAAAQTGTTVFRIRQIANNGDAFDNWAIDNFNLNLNGVDRRVEQFTTTFTTTTIIDNITTTVDVFTLEEDPSLPNLRSIDVRTPDLALQSLKVVDRAIEEVSLARGEIGAFERNTLEATQSNVRSQLVNLERAESILRDTDFALEITNLFAQQVRRDVGGTVLGIANQNALNLVGLLQNSPAAALQTGARALLPAV